MAHIAKYKAHSVGHMLAHYRRDQSSLGRENIDPSRTHLNRLLGLYQNENGGLGAWQVKPIEGEPWWDTVKARIDRADAQAELAGKRRTRKDAVVMADLVVTLPENVPPEDEARFFCLTYTWLAMMVGPRNLLGGFVHCDEVRKDGTPVRDHMHMPFTPIVEGRFNFKKMFPRSRYQALHKSLGDFLERQMGYRPAVELGEEERRERVYADKASEIDAVRDAVEASVAPLRAERSELLAERVQLLCELDTARDKLEAARRDRDEAVKARDAAVEERDAAVEERDAAVEAVSELTRRASGLAADVEGLRADKASLEAETSRLRRAYAVLRDEVAEFVEGVRAHVSALAAARRGSSSFWDALAEFIDNSLVSKAFAGALGHMGAPGDNERVLEDESVRVLGDESERISGMLDGWGDEI